jgi:hypothetical protein
LNIGQLSRENTPPVLQVVKKEYSEELDFSDDDDGEVRNSWLKET